ncbi:MAG: hypothetical protein DMF88_21990 [Acidobacteria bacterium]|nr:MAG: hypothetical protein DMF88_21990 [Acidobacteriota bacterium]
MAGAQLHAAAGILVTARDSHEDLVSGLDAGADDYMVKPLNMAELQARVKVGVRVAKLQQNLTQNNKDLRSTRDHLALLASTDVLTGVYTRRWWFDLAAKEFSRGRRYGRTFSLLMLDLDWFKQINDTFGHETGDRMLNQFGEMLRVTCRQSDLIGRIGGVEESGHPPHRELPLDSHPRRGRRRALLVQCRRHRSAGRR